ncbi:MAG: septum formation initiator family protein [Bacilli bacterium]|nr:septum formation initiator family protein [Bacilli bacterium]
MKRRKKKASGNRLILFGGISVFIILFFVLSLVNFIFQVKNLNNEQKDIQSQIMSLEDEEEYLKNEIIKLKDPEYLARYARENYMYSKDGEYVIRIYGSDTEEEIEDADLRSNRYYYELIVIGIAFFLFIILKKVFSHKKKKSR